MVDLYDVHRRFAAATALQKPDPEEELRRFIEQNNIAPISPREPVVYHEGQTPGERAATNLLLYPQKIANEAWEAFSAPRDAWMGELDPLSEEGMQRALNLGGMVTLGAGALPRSVTAGTLMAGAKRRATPDIIDPTPKVSAPGFYSSLERYIAESPQKSAMPDHWLASIRNAPGIKQEEIDWSGIEDFMGKGNAGPVLKEELLAHVQGRTPKLTFHTRSGPSEDDLEDMIYERANEFNQEGPYVEDLWDYNFNIARDEIYDEIGEPENLTLYSDFQVPGGENYREIIATWDNTGFKDPLYQHGHWEDYENPILHIRVNDQNVNNKKTLMAEEIQSDWHQEARKARGYFDPNDQVNGVSAHAPPDAPFKKAWPDVALKKMIIDAVDGGYEQIGWIGGKEQFERMGGTLEGQMGFYDDIMPKRANKLLKKYNAKVEKQDLLHNSSAQQKELMSDLNRILDRKNVVANEMANSDSYSMYSQKTLELKYLEEAEAETRQKLAAISNIKYADDTDVRTRSRSELTIYTIPITPELRKAVQEDGLSLFAKGSPGAPIDMSAPDIPDEYRRAIAEALARDAGLSGELY